jgi:hypothetical protein
MLYLTHPSHPLSFITVIYFKTRMKYESHHYKALIFFHPHPTCSPLGPNIVLSTLFSNTFKLYPYLSADVSEDITDRRSTRYRPIYYFSFTEHSQYIAAWGSFMKRCLQNALIKQTIPFRMSLHFLIDKLLAGSRNICWFNQQAVRV